MVMQMVMTMVVDEAQVYCAITFTRKSGTIPLIVASDDVDSPCIGLREEPLVQPCSR